ncbi:MAG TPA: hypothetical protein VI895_06195 [Bdellovibrionota bacterium]|nr:hypothetical protein [Bdellovibrionota bacterium]
MLPEVIQVALQVAQSFEQFKIPYFVVGSVASSILGEPRSTNDVDIVAQLSEVRAKEWIVWAEKDFYVSETAVIEAIRRHRAFNLVHFSTALKIDIYCAGDSAYEGEQLSRRRLVPVVKDAATSLVMSTPEDVVLNKLCWYRKGGEVSDRQWRDVIGVLKVQSDRLEFSYLGNWATNLAISDLLRKALAEAGLSGASPA